MDDNVFINGLSAVHAKSNGTLITSDTCLTPPLCVPIPYTNVAKSKDAANTASTVKIKGQPACTILSNFAKSEGDGPGTCGGIISGTIKGKAEFITGSDNVFFQGIPAARNGDKMVSNNKNTAPMPLIQSNGGKPPEINSNEPAELEAAEINDDGDWDICHDPSLNLKSILTTMDTSDAE